MKKSIKVTLWIINFLVILFLIVFSQIQRSYAEKERVKAIIAQRIADENALKAQAVMEEAEKSAARAVIEMKKAQFLKAELEKCKTKK